MPKNQMRFDPGFIPAKPPKFKYSHCASTDPVRLHEMINEWMRAEQEKVERATVPFQIAHTITTVIPYLRAGQEEGVDEPGFYHMVQFLHT
jgi:hypothetical protein